MKKICTKCGIEKKLNEFCKNKKSKDGYNFKCKLCRKAYYLENKEEANKYSHKNYILNKNNIIKYCKNYRKVNKKVLLEKRLKYNKEKYHNDVNYKLVTILRCRIYDVIKNGNKSLKSINLLGCDVEFYKKYLESQFKPEMNWSNHGTIWEIDHIIPLNKFDLTKPEEQFKAFNYTNTQPLFKTTEIAKSFGYLNEIGNKEKK